MATDTTTATTAKITKKKRIKKRKVDWITLRDVCDDNTSISSTRWAFATIVKVDVAVILATIAAGLVAHFLPSVDDFDSSFYGSVAMLLGTLTAFVTGTKVMQGFEPKKDKDTNVQQAQQQQQQAVPQEVVTKKDDPTLGAAVK